MAGLKWHTLILKIIFFPSPLPLQEQYNNLPVDVKVTQLLTALHTNTLNEEARHMAAVVLRRLFASEFQEFYTAVSKMEMFIVLCPS